MSKTDEAGTEIQIGDLCVNVNYSHMMVAKVTAMTEKKVWIEGTRLSPLPVNGEWYERLSVFPENIVVICSDTPVNRSNPELGRLWQKVDTVIAAHQAKERK